MPPVRESFPCVACALSFSTAAALQEHTLGVGHIKARYLLVTLIVLCRLEAGAYLKRCLRARHHPRRFAAAAKRRMFPLSSCAASPCPRGMTVILVCLPALLLVFSMFLSSCFLCFSPQVAQRLAKQRQRSAAAARSQQTPAAANALAVASWSFVGAAPGAPAGGSK